MGAKKRRNESKRVKTQMVYIYEAQMRVASQELCPRFLSFYKKIDESTKCKNIDRMSMVWICKIQMKVKGVKIQIAWVYKIIDE